MFLYVAARFLNSLSLSQSSHLLFFLQLHAELAPNVQKDHDTDKTKGSDQDGGGSNLESGTIVRVELQNVVSCGGISSTTGSSHSGSCCSASLCCLR